MKKIIFLSLLGVLNSHFSTFEPKTEVFKKGILKNDLLKCVSKNKESSNHAGEKYLYAIPYNAKTCDKFYYFEKLGAKYGLNQATCGVVAAQVLLGYYDTFENDDIVPEIYDQPAVMSSIPTGTTIPIQDFTTSPGTDDRNNGISSFHNYICSVCQNELGFNPIGHGTTSTQDKKMLTKMLDKSGVGYTYKCVVDNGNKTKNLIKEAIDNGRPCFAGGTTHVMVAVAYNSDYVWVVDGRADGKLYATPWSTFTSDRTADAFDITSISTHKHSNNYYDSNNKHYYCGCGYSESDTQFDNMILGYGTTPNIQVKNFAVEQLQVETKYWNTQSLGTTGVIMWPRSGSDGEAYIEFLGNKACYGFDFSMCYVSSSDRSYRNMFRCEYWALERRTDAWYWVDYHDIDMTQIPDSATGEKRFSYKYEPNKFIGFRLIIKPTSSSCSARVAITNIHCHHALTEW